MIHTKGYSLMETLIVISLMSMLTVAVGTLIVSFYRTNSFTLERTLALESARRGVLSVATDIREARYGDNGAYPVVRLGPYEMVFYADTDKSGDIEQVRYFVQDGVLQKGIVRPTGSPAVYTDTEAIADVIPYVQNQAQGVPLFTFYASTSAELANTSAIRDLRFVEIRILADVNPIRAPDVVQLTGSATLRGVKE